MKRSHGKPALTLVVNHEISPKQKKSQHVGVKMRFGVGAIVGTGVLVLLAMYM